MPTDSLFLLALAQAFEQADTGLVGIKRIDSSDHDEAIPVPIKGIPLQTARKPR
jgi:hypothetical protein